MDPHHPASLERSVPRPYMRKMPATWWLRQRSYFYFMLREITAVFVAAYIVILLVLLWHIKQGPMQYADWVATLETPASIGFHFVALLAAAYHSITWFNLTPQIMVIRRGEEKVPPVWMRAGNYLIWILVSALLIWLVIGR